MLTIYITDISLSYYLQVPLATCYTGKTAEQMTLYAARCKYRSEQGGTESSRVMGSAPSVIPSQAPVPRPRSRVTPCVLLLGSCPWQGRVPRDTPRSRTRHGHGHGHATVTDTDTVTDTCSPARLSAAAQTQPRTSALPLRLFCSSFLKTKYAF